MYKARDKRPKLSKKKRKAKKTKDEGNIFYPFARSLLGEQIPEIEVTLNGKKFTL